MKPLPIIGCRHDVLGHNLKAIGLMRALTHCAKPEDRDTEAEGWWNLDRATFCVRSQKYDTLDKLADFLALRYVATQPISAWDKDIGYKPGRVDPPPSEQDLALAKRL